MVICIFAFLVISCSYCSRYIAPLDFKGVVKEKYLSSYKDQPVIVVNARGETIEFGPNDHKFYELIQVGDSLIKKKGYYDFVIKRKDFSEKYTLNCDF